MLYERWRQIAREHRNATALSDLARGERWTFAQLAVAAESNPASGPLAFPQGPQFIFTLLRAWHAGQIVCPLEPDQPAPEFTRLPSNCVHLKTTSATTGAPRVVAFTAEQLAADAENIVATMGLRSDWPNLGVISLAHSYGFSNLVLPLLLHGIPLILVDSPLPETVRQAATAAESITLPAVPALWRAWQEAGAIPGNIRLAISAGAPLSLALEEAVFAAHRVKIHNFYGSSECGGIAYDASSVPRADPACVGRAMQNVHLSVGGNGCLQVRGRAVGETYWPEPSSNLGAGCFLTSDLVEVSEGVVYMRGRAGDQINVAGRKLSPEVIEKVLLAHPAVGDCLVFGAPSADAERTETIVACIASKTPVSAESLKHFLLEELPAWQIPREWLFVDSLEANQRGKLSRAEWRRKFVEGRGWKMP
ncbi:MAG TPA: class I adenylate-forming enzyme family protein [Verrucomicrobiae bacterium]|nr:class I adenylate-forming enzyme family protein [Verrucomicrobiae bacterium]